MELPSSSFPLNRHLRRQAPLFTNPSPATDLGDHGVEDGGSCLLSLHPHRRVMGTVHLGKEEGGRGFKRKSGQGGDTGQHRG